MDDHTKIDFSARKTEAEWLTTIDRFWLAITPKLFEWLSWVALLAAISFVQKKTDSPWLSFFVFICTTSMMFYFHALFSKIEFTGFLKNHPKIQRCISFIFSTLLATGAYYLALSSINVLIAANPV